VQSATPTNLNGSVNGDKQFKGTREKSINANKEDVDTVTRDVTAAHDNRKRKTNKTLLRNGGIEEKQEVIRTTEKSFRKGISREKEKPVVSKTMTVKELTTPVKGKMLPKEIFADKSAITLPINSAAKDTTILPSFEANMASPPPTQVEKPIADTKKSVDETIVKHADKKAPIKKQLSNKWNFGLTFYPGISANTKGIREIGGGQDRLFASPNSSSLGSAFVASNSLDYNSSFSFGAGVFAQRQLGKRWNVTAGIDYHLYTATNQTGARIDSSRSLQDNTLDKKASLSFFYLRGESRKHKNQYHLLEVPINFRLRLNKNIDRPSEWTIGVLPGVLLGSQALYYNQQAMIYYNEKEQFNRLQLSMQTGFSFNIIANKKTLVNLGPVLQYGLINLTRPAGYTNEHLLFYGLKTNILFKK
jgi:hypothetical protein